MQLSCSAYSFPLLRFEDSLRLVRLLGMDHADVHAFSGGTHLQPEEIAADPLGAAERARRAAEDARVSFVDFFPAFGGDFYAGAVNSPDRSVRWANRVRFQAAIRFCRAVGCGGITLLPGVTWPEIGQAGSLSLAADALSELVYEGRSAGLRVSVEPHLESVVERPERALELVEAVEGLQLTLDYSHFVAAGIPEERVHPLIPYAGHVHARQATLGKLQAPSGEGIIDFSELVRRLSAAGYQGFLCVEYVWQDWGGCKNLDVVSETVLLREQLLRAMQAADPHSQSATQQEVGSLPSDPKGGRPCRGSHSFCD